VTTNRRVTWNYSRFEFRRWTRTGQEVWRNLVEPAGGLDNGTCSWRVNCWCRAVSKSLLAKESLEGRFACEKACPGFHVFRCCLQAANGRPGQNPLFPATGTGKTGFSRYQFWFWPVYSQKGDCQKSDCQKGDCQKGFCRKSDCQLNDCQKGADLIDCDCQKGDWQSLFWQTPFWQSPFWQSLIWQSPFWLHAGYTPPPEFRSRPCMASADPVTVKSWWQVFWIGPLEITSQKRLKWFYFGT